MGRRQSTRDARAARDSSSSSTWLTHACDCTPLWFAQRGALAPQPPPPQQQRVAYVPPAYTEQDMSQARTMPPMQPMQQQAPMQPYPAQVQYGVAQVAQPMQPYSAQAYAAQPSQYAPPQQQGYPMQQKGATAPPPNYTP